MCFTQNKYFVTYHKTSDFLFEVKDSPPVDFSAIFRERTEFSVITAKEGDIIAVCCSFMEIIVT